MGGTNPAECGKANPDIAGPGIVISFISAAVLTSICSFATYILSLKQGQWHGFYRWRRSARTTTEALSLVQSTGCISLMLPLIAMFIKDLLHVGSLQDHYALLGFLLANLSLLSTFTALLMVQEVKTTLLYLAVLAQAITTIGDLAFLSSVFFRMTEMPAPIISNIGASFVVPISALLYWSVRTSIFLLLKTGLGVDSWNKRISARTFLAALITATLPLALGIPPVVVVKYIQPIRAHGWGQRHDDTGKWYWVPPPNHGCSLNTDGDNDWKSTGQIVAITALFIPLIAGAWESYKDSGSGEPFNYHPVSPKAAYPEVDWLYDPVSTSITGSPARHASQQLDVELDEGPFSLATSNAQGVAIVNSPDDPVMSGGLPSERREEPRAPPVETSATSSATAQTTT